MHEHSSPPVRVDGALASVAFDRFGLDAYALFLRCKALPESRLSYDWRADRYTLTTPARFAPLLGAELPPRDGGDLPLAGHLFDYQAFCVRAALAARRYALWLETGLGKTACFLEWARQVQVRTAARVLILSPLAVIPQTIEEARRFYGDGLPIERIETREALVAWCAAPGSALGICNYEKLIPGVIDEFRFLGGLACDESSLLKSGGGVIKWNLIKSAKGVEYKLSCTATPAPNDTMEYASQASFLERLRAENDVLWTYFTRDKAGNWRVKPHAREAFYRFMASWSIYLRSPARFGWADVLADLPPPEIVEESLPITDVQREMMYGLIQAKGGGLFSDDRLGVAERSKLSQLAKGFLYGEGGTARYPSHKPARVAELVRQEVAAGRQVLVWTVFDAEGAIVAESLAGAPFEVGMLTGDMPESARLAVLERFRNGELAALISKASLLGFGLNFQFCRSMIFSGFDDSFERMYQAIRRAYRFGQTETVRVFVPYVPELEGMVFANVKRKQQLFDRDTAAQEIEYKRAMADLLPALGASA